MATLEDFYTKRPDPRFKVGDVLSLIGQNVTVTENTEEHYSFGHLGGKRQLLVVSWWDGGELRSKKLSRSEADLLSTTNQD